MEKYYLSDGTQLPKIGFGTSRLKGAKAVATVTMAIQNGYRVIDTAYKYENEGAIGAALRRSGVPRGELYVVSKLPGKAYQRQAAFETVEESLMRIGLDYFDLYLLHWPNPQRDEYIEAWQALIDMQQAGLVKSIGVSNFLPEYLQRLQKETGVWPVVNQIKMNPFFPQKDLLAYDKAHGILTADWSPLGSGNQLLKAPILVNLSNQYHKNAGQIVIRWALQRGTLPLPKSTNAQRQQANLDVFDFALSDQDMAQIDTLALPEGKEIWQGPATTENL